MEKDLLELQSLFQQKKAGASLNAVNVERRAKTDLSALKFNHLTTIATFVATAVLLVFIDKINAEKINTSLLGLSILIGCSLYYALSKTYLLWRLNAIKPTGSITLTITLLERYKKLNIFMHTYGEVLYAIVLSIGLYFYLRPVLDTFLLDHTNRTLLCFWWIWGAGILWMCFYTFVIKRKRMKKDIEALEAFRSSLREGV